MGRVRTSRIRAVRSACSSDPSAQRQGGLVLRPPPPRLSAGSTKQAAEDLPLGRPEGEPGEREPGGTGKVVAGRGRKGGASGDRGGAELAAMWAGPCGPGEALWT